MATVEIKVPDIGDFTDVEIIEVHVAAGDEVQQEDPLITLESDKASMDVPATEAGTVEEVRVEQGGRVSEGDVILVLATAAAVEAEEGPKKRDGEEEREREERPARDERRAPAATPSAGRGDVQAEVVVLGSGPGGYTAAFRAADLGRKVVLVERYPTLGGVCLNVGCIPSKALLHVARVIAETREMAEHGLEFGEPKIDLDRMRSWKDGVVKKLTDGLAGLARRRNVEVVQGTGRFTAPDQLVVETGNGTTTVGFEQAIIAAGSEAIYLPFIPRDDPRVFSSTGALEIEDIPERLLVLGGGIIGLEMANVYAELGSRVTVAELLPQLMSGADPDLVKPLQKRIEALYENVLLETRATDVKANRKGLEVSFEGRNAPEKDTFDKILVAVGRRPNGKAIGADAAGIEVTEQGFIPVDGQQRTNVHHIFAIGDIVGQPMLAHKASHEGKVAAEVAAGRNSWFDARGIPSVAFTDPEVAWVGVTETEAREKGIRYGKGQFPWAASGRSLGMARDEGLTKLLFDEESERVIGAGMVGPHAGDLVSEAGLAIEMGADARDIGLTIHPHPTLSETVAFSAEAFEGTITDLYVPKKR